MALVDDDFVVPLRRDGHLTHRVATSSTAQRGHELRLEVLTEYPGDLFG